MSYLNQCCCVVVEGGCGFVGGLMFVCVCKNVMCSVGLAKCVWRCRCVSVFCFGICVVLIVFLCCVPCFGGVLAPYHPLSCIQNFVL